MSQLEIAHQCGRQQIACKLHQKCEQRSQTVIAQIDGFAEFVVGKGLSDTHTPTRTPLPTPNQGRGTSSAWHFSPATVIRRPPAANNDRSCVNVAAGWVCLLVCASYFDGFLPAAATACVRLPDYGTQISHYPCVRRRGP